MADKKITELTAADDIDGTELIPVVQAGATKKATAEQLRQITVSTDPPASPYLNQLWVPTAP